MDRLPKPFKLHAGHPALELVNTLDMRFTADTIELLPAYQDLLRFTVQLRVLSPEQARKLERATPEKQAKRVLAAVVELREALATVCYAWMDGKSPSAAAIAILEKHFHAAASQRRLSNRQSQLQWSWPGKAQQAEIPLWELAQSAADLLLSSDAALLRDCGDPTCRWLFLDLSKNHTRRWCDMKTCGNRMKARRYQARLQEEPI